MSLPVDRGGCGWYRVRQPFQAIQDYTDSDTHVIDKEHDDPIQVIEGLLKTDVLVCRQGSEMSIDEIRDAANEYAKETNQPGFHAKVVVDIDDNVEIISPYSPHYEEYGTKIPDDPRLKEAASRMDLPKNRSRILSLQLGMRKADLVTVTTEKLAEYARQFNGNVAVLPNAINTKVWWKLDFKPHKQLRVGWSGGHSHYEDWITIKKPLNKLLRKYQFKLVMAGSAFTGLIDDDLQHLVEVMPWVPFEAHSFRMMCMNLDMAIIPLADLPFNHYKSPVKLLEMSAMGVPSLVAGVPPYNTSGFNATLFYENSKDFEEKLEALLNPVSRENLKILGDSALREVDKNWSAEKHALNYLNAYRAIL